MRDTFEDLDSATSLYSAPETNLLYCTYLPTNLQLGISIHKENPRTLVRYKPLRSSCRCNLFPITLSHHDYWSSPKLL